MKDKGRNGGDKGTEEGGREGGGDVDRRGKGRD